MNGAAGRLAAVTAGLRPPGVYRWLSRAHTESVRRELSTTGWSVHLLDGRGIASATHLFDRCAEVLSFPGWFGHNWDALADCLGDLSWLPGSGHVLLWDQYGVLARSDPKAWAMAYEVFRLPRTVPLYVLLRGGPAEAPTGPELIPPL